MRHKQILDVAADNPEASIDDLAAEVPSATTDLVEQVLEEYGDPAGETEVSTDDQQSLTDSDSPESVAPSESTSTDDAEVDSQMEGTTVTSAEATADSPDRSESAEATETDSATVVREPGELSERQLATLRAIADDPAATQREIADALGVTAPTVSTRVNNIEGFEWSDRAAYVEAIFDSDSQPDTDMSSNSSETETQLAQPELRQSIDELTSRVEAIETTLEELSVETDSTQTFDDPELVHKIVRACMESESVSEDEELEIIRRFFD